MMMFAHHVGDKVYIMQIPDEEIDNLFDMLCLSYIRENNMILCYDNGFQFLTLYVDTEKLYKDKNYLYQLIEDGLRKSNKL